MSALVGGKERLLWLLALCALGLYHSWRLASIERSQQSGSNYGLEDAEQGVLVLRKEVNQDAKEEWVAKGREITREEREDNFRDSSKVALDSTRQSAASATSGTCAPCICDAGEKSALVRPCTFAQMNKLNSRGSFKEGTNLFDDFPQIEVDEFQVKEIAGTVGGLRPGSEVRFFQATLGGLCDAYVWEVKDGFRIEMLMINSDEYLRSKNSLIAYAYEGQLRNVLVVFSDDEYDAIQAFVRNSSQLAHSLAADNVNVLEVDPRPAFLKPLPAIFDVRLSEKWNNLTSLLSSSFNSECISTLLWDDAKDNARQLSLYPGCSSRAATEKVFGDTRLVDVEDIERRLIGFAKYMNGDDQVDVRVYFGTIRGVSELSLVVVRVKAAHTAQCPMFDKLVLAFIAPTPKSFFCAYPLSDDIEMNGDRETSIRLIRDLVSDQLDFVDDQAKNFQRQSPKLVNFRQQFAEVLKTVEFDPSTGERKQDEISKHFEAARESVFKDFLINWDEIDSTFGHESVLGYGGFGTVFNVSYRGQPAALKVSKEPAVIHEAVLMALAIGQKDIVQLFGVAHVRHKIDHFALVMQLAPGKDMRLFEVMPPLQVLPPFLRAVEALERLHNSGVVHLDIKESNFNIGPVEKQVDLQVTLIDLGISVPIGAYSGAGTDSYMGPERRGPVKIANMPAVDVYGMGAILLKASKESGEACFKLKQIKIDAGVPLCALAVWCLAGDPTLRPPLGRLAAILHQLERFWQVHPEMAKRRAASSLLDVPRLPQSLEQWLPRPITTRSHYERLGLSSNDILFQLFGQLAKVHQRGFSIMVDPRKAALVMVLPANRTVFIVSQPSGNNSPEDPRVLASAIAREVSQVCKWYKRLIGTESKSSVDVAVLQACQQGRTASELFLLVSNNTSEANLSRDFAPTSSDELLTHLKKLVGRKHGSFWRGELKKEGKKM